MKLLTWWISRVRYIGKGDFWIRFTPNPGIAFRIGMNHYRWSVKKGFRKEDLNATIRQTIR